MRKLSFTNYLITFLSLSLMFTSCIDDDSIVTVNSKIQFNFLINDNGTLNDGANVIFTNLATRDVDTVVLNSDGVIDIVLEAGSYSVVAKATVDYPTCSVPFNFVQNNVVVSEESKNYSFQLIQGEKLYKKFDVNFSVKLDGDAVQNVKIYYTNIESSKVDSLITGTVGGVNKVIQSGRYNISAIHKSGINIFADQIDSLLITENLDISLSLKKKSILTTPFFAKIISKETSLPLANKSVVLVNKLSQKQYEIKTNAQGEIVDTIEYGDYTIVYRVYNEKHTASFDLTENTEILNIELTKSLIKEKLIISEMYYRGSKTPEGKSYRFDQFVELYNNSDEVLYLDGICFGYNQHTSTSTYTKWMKPEGGLMDHLPVWGYTWMIPGNGTDRPLKPGESIVLSTLPIDHKAINPNSVDLSNSDLEFYISVSTQAVDYPEIPNLKIFGVTGSSRSKVFMLMGSGTAAFIFRIPNNDHVAFDANTENIQTRPDNPKKRAAMIHNSLVIDAVEGVYSGEKNYKRLHAHLDAGYVISTEYGTSVTRKIKDVIDGRTVYQDTNNSTNDFVNNTIPTPNTIN